MSQIENRTFDEIQIGETASIEHTITRRDIDLFGIVSGDVNPAHFDEEYAASGMFGKTIAHGMLSGALISTVLGMHLPGPGTIYLSQSLRFRRPVYIGDTLTVSATVTEKKADKKRVVLDCACVNQDGDTVTVGTAEVIAPTEKIIRPRTHLPDVQFVDAS